MFTIKDIRVVNFYGWVEDDWVVVKSEIQFLREGMFQEWETAKVEELNPVAPNK